MQLKLARRIMMHGWWGLNSILQNGTVARVKLFLARKIELSRWFSQTLWCILHTVWSLCTACMSLHRHHLSTGLAFVSLTKTLLGSEQTSTKCSSPRHHRQWWAQTCRGRFGGARRWAFWWACCVPCRQTLAALGSVFQEELYDLIVFAKSRGVMPSMLVTFRLLWHSARKLNWWILLMLYC